MHSALSESVRLLHGSAPAAAAVCTLGCTEAAASSEQHDPAVASTSSPSSDGSACDQASHVAGASDGMDALSQHMPLCSMSPRVGLTFGEARVCTRGDVGDVASSTSRPGDAEAEPED